MIEKSLPNIVFNYTSLFCMQSDTRRTFSVHANWTYDAINERVRIDEGIRTNMSEYRQYYDTIIFFREVSTV